MSDEVIERNAVAGGLEADAGFHHFRVGRDGLQYFQNNPFLGKQRHVVVHEGFPRAVKEADAVVAEKIETREERAVEGAAARDIRILAGREAVLPAIAKEELVAEEAPLAVEDGLARDEAQILAVLRGTGGGGMRHKGDLYSRLIGKDADNCRAEIRRWADTFVQ